MAKRKSTKGKQAAYRGSAHTSEPVPTEPMRIAGKEKKVRKTWAKIAKGRTEDELETIDSNKRNDLDEPNHVKAKRMSG